MIEAAMSGAIAAVISGISAYFSAKAAKNSRPVANGFTGHVTNELRYLRERLDKHLDAHHGGI